MAGTAREEFYFLRLTGHLGIVPFLKMAGVTGLEPAASCVTGKRSNQLSYTPKMRENNVREECGMK